MIKSHEMITESYNICELITKLIHEANINETVAWFCHWTYGSVVLPLDLRQQDGRGSEERPA